MRKIALILLILSFFALILSLWATYNNDKLTKEELEYLKNKKEIIFVSQNNYPPFEFLDESFKSTGMMVELVRWISTEFSFKAKFLNTTFANAQAMVLNGQADCITSFFYSETRDKLYDFTETVYKIPASIFVNTKNTEIHLLKDLNGKKIAIQKGDYAIDFLKEHDINFTLIETDDFLSALSELLNENADAVVGDEQIIIYYLQKFNKINKTKIVGKPLYIGLNSFATKEGNILINILSKGIRVAKKRGIIDAIERKWLGYSTEQNVIYFILKYIYILIILLILFVLMFLWNYLLQRKVAEKTYELQKTNEKLNAIINSSPDGIGIIDIGGKLIYISEKLAQMYGYNKDEVKGLIGKNFIEFIFEEHREEIKKNIQKLLTNNKSFELTEYIAYKKDKSKFWIEISSALLKDVQGNPKSIIFIERDITKRKQIEQEIITKNVSLRQAYENARYLQAKADTANEMKSRFLAIITHELRTPLNAIIGQIELMNYNKNTNNFKISSDQLDMLKASADLLLVLINDLSDLIKVEQNKLIILEKHFKLNELINMIIFTGKLYAKEKGLDFKFDVNFDYNILLFGDEARVKQILLNLATNAVKYTNKGFVKFSVEKVSENENTINLKFVFEDTGIGIKEEDIEKIFLPFYQIEKGYNKKYYGSGIGLYLVKTLLALMKSEIYVESTPNKGSKFYFELTFKKFASGETNGNDIYLLPIKALVVDDVESNLIILREMLKKININSDGAVNGEEAVKMAKKNKYDIIFMDLQMPEMDGFDATNKIREFDKDVIIVAASANVYEDDIQKSLKMGMNDFLSKPYKIKNLQNIILKYFGIELKGKTINENELIHTYKDEQLFKNVINNSIKEIEKSFSQIEKHFQNNNFELIRQILPDMKLSCDKIYAEKLSIFIELLYNSFYSIRQEKIGDYLDILKGLIDEIKNYQFTLLQ